MSSSSIPLSPLRLSLLFLLFTFHTTTTTAQDLINTTCKTCSQNNPNIKFNFCTTSLQSSPASQCAGDLHTIPRTMTIRTISIKLVQSNVTDTNCFIKQLIKNKKLIDPFIERCLEDCFDLYSDAIPSVEQAMENYDLERFVDANVELSSVMDAATTCEDGFKEKRGVVSPLTKRNGDTFELSAMALSIMGMLQTGSQY
ncbi:hypothetical protein ACSBR1_017301 [Camellia fascicularis]